MREVRADKRSETTTKRGCRTLECSESMTDGTPIRRDLIQGIEMHQQATRQRAIQAGGICQDNGQAIVMSLKALDQFAAQSMRMDMQWVINTLRTMSDSPQIRDTPAQAVLQAIANDWRPLGLV